MRTLKLVLFLLPAAVAAAVPVMPAAAKDTLGTAGRFRSIHVQGCGKPMLAQLRGACDPPPVDAKLLTVTEQVQAHIARAKTLMLMMRMPQARQAADRALALDPNDLAALTFRARLALMMMDNRTALRDVNAALKVAPSDADLLATRAEIWFDRTLYDLALPDANAAVEAEPTDVDALCIRGRILINLERPKDARADFDQATKLEPSYGRAWLFRANADLHLGDYITAVTDANEALRQNPGDLSAMETRATARFGLGQLQKAADDLTLILGKPGDKSHPPPTSPGEQRLILQRVIIFITLGRDEEAQKDLDMMLLAGRTRAVLRLQLYLRRNGFPDVRITGKRSARFNDALHGCFLQRECWHGLTRYL